MVLRYKNDYNTSTGKRYLSTNGRVGGCSVDDGFEECTNACQDDVASAEYDVTISGNFSSGGGICSAADCDNDIIGTYRLTRSGACTYSITGQGGFNCEFFAITMSITLSSGNTVVTVRVFAATSGFDATYTKTYSGVTDCTSINDTLSWASTANETKCSSWQNDITISVASV